MDLDFIITGPGTGIYPVTEPPKGNGVAGMPRYYFDLMNGEVVADDGGLVLKNDAHAVFMGDRLSKQLFDSRPELRGGHCAIVVRDKQKTEFYRAAI